MKLTLRPFLVDVITGLSNFQYYIALWITESNSVQSGNRDNDLHAIIQTNSPNFINGHVSDIKHTVTAINWIHTDTSTSKKIKSSVSVIEDPLIIDVHYRNSLNKDNATILQDLSDQDIKLCYILYKKTMKLSLEQSLSQNCNESQSNSSKICSGSINIASMFYYLLNTDTNDRVSMFSFPLTDYTQRVQFSQHSNSSYNKMSSNSSSHSSKLCEPTIGYMTLLVSNENKNQQTQLNHFVYRHFCSIFKDENYGFNKSYYPEKIKILVDKELQTNRHTNTKTLLQKLFYDSLEVIVTQLNRVDSNVTFLTSFVGMMNDVITHDSGTISSLNSLLNKHPSNETDMNVSSMESKEDTLLQCFSKLSETSIIRWYKLKKATEKYVEAVKTVFDFNGSGKMKYFGRDLDVHNSDYVTFKPDVPSLKNLKRFYWIIDDTKVPYPHYTKLCLPEIHIPITGNNNVPFDYGRKYHQTKLKVDINDCTETLFIKLLDLACLRYGLKDRHQFSSTIEEAFCVEFNTDHNSLLNNTFTFWCTYNGKFNTKLENYLKGNTKENYDLMTLISIMGDFISSIACSTEYKTDSRMIKMKTYSNNGHLLSETLVNHDTDSLDFDVLAGLNVECDCDEGGLFSDYIYSVLCLGRHRNDKSCYHPWNDKGLQALTFLAIQYIDYCVFGNVDGDKPEINNQHDKSKDDNSGIDTSPDYLYNKYDMKGTCEMMGHTFVVMVPFCDVANTYTSNKNKYTNKALELNMLEIVEGINIYQNSVRNYIIDTNISELNNYIIKLGNILPRIIIEGTAKQDCLQMYTNEYYGTNNSYADSITERCILVDKLLSTENRMNENNVKDQDYTSALLKSMTQCGYQKKSYEHDETTKRESKYRKRAVDFYRRISQSTSQMIRSIMKRRYGNNSKESFRWDNLICVNIDKMSWGVPVTHILSKTDKNDTLFIPQSDLLFNTYTVTKLTTGLNVDLFSESFLSWAVPRANFEHLQIDQNELYNLSNETSSMKQITQKAETTVFFSTRLIRGEITNHDKKKIRSHLLKLMNVMNMKIDIKICIHRSMPWFDQELTLIITS